MAERGLQGRRILVVEDEYLVADELSYALAAAGAEVLGPFACVEDAVATIAAEPRIDGAILDVNLRGGAKVYPVADTLAKRNIPFVLTTGYDLTALPSRFATTPRLEKPSKPAKVMEVLSPLVEAANPSPLAAGGGHGEAMGG